MQSEDTVNTKESNEKTDNQILNWNYSQAEERSSTPTDFKQNLKSAVDKMIPESPLSSDTEDTLKFDPMDAREIINSANQSNSNESIRTWLERITQMQNEIQKKLHVSHQVITNDSVNKATNYSTNQNPNRIVKYQDLPYMGEMTLDNSKPRRGRKPKKADICHLIYKNYGTIYPGTPNAKSILDKNVARKLPLEQKLGDALTENLNHTDVQNRIISSLLEKRLTQESKRHKEVFSNKIKSQLQHEPLNLCMRDIDHLKITHPNTINVIEVKSEIKKDDNIQQMEEDLTQLADFNYKFTPSSDENITPALSAESVKVTNSCSSPNGYVYWPNAGVFIHPMALQQQLLYYQKMATNNTNKTNCASTTIIDAQSSELRKLEPKQSKLKKIETNENDYQITENKSKRNASSNDKIPAKRKRSAIFIPPIPTENQNNPATEVSICKFKFTGGAKPSLQEKKMLSVDSGGNFRYYSGTGDKSMRGYEFFPRETLQQQVHNTQGSSTGAFLQASGEKIYTNSPIDFNGKATNEFMLPTEIHTASSSTLDSPQRNKKRKSRKSIQREKLERTFKEKGFLIQTQQLESAEGATYCKFRQLRKFTRYLFRSWKDYLPGNVANNQDVPDKAELDDATELDNESMSNLSSPGTERNISPPP